MTPVSDLSGPLAQQLKRTLEQARSLRQAGNYPAAAQSYRRCGALQVQLAEYAVNKDVKAQQLQLARTYLEQAEQLEQRATPQVEPAGGDDLTSQVAALRTRAATTWEDIGNLAECKAAIQAAYAFALVQRPAGVQHRPVSKILLYGPPGTGKTMLAAAASNQLDAAFYSVKASDLLSKWFGESPRLISTLYREAVRNAPAVIFLEEFDALASRRSDSDSGAERRIVSTLLAELDGLVDGATPAGYVLTIAATNLPWTIDKAVLGRFGARLLHVPLPDAQARGQIIAGHLQGRGYQTAVPVTTLVERTAGYSGRDLANLLGLAIEQMELQGNPQVLTMQDKDALSRYQLRIAPLNAEHFTYAFARITPQTSPADVQRFADWCAKLD